jgi:glycosyltransferase involved in cell wall biosynthesis
LKILNVVASLDAVEGGGTAERTYQMSRCLAMNGIDTSILTLDLGLTPERLHGLGDVAVTALPSLWKRFFVPIFSPAKIRDLVREADVVHLMNHWTLINAIVYTWVRRLGKPYVVCPAGALISYGRSQGLKRAYDALIGRAIIGNASGHIAVVSSEIPQFEPYAVSREEVVVIPNGVFRNDVRDYDPEMFRERFGLGDDPLILFLGRLNPIKGPDLLLEAFIRIERRFPQYHLVFAGPDNGMLAMLRQRTREAELGGKVHFTGYVDAQMKHHGLRSADLVVIPSRHEAMSIVVLEAGMAARPVLLTDQCGLDQIGSVGGGRVVTPTVEGLEQGLLQLLSDPAKLETMGETLRRYTLDHYSWEAIVPKYIDLYARILETAQDY